MKRLTIILFVLLIALVATDCKKKYPKDIPKWLKEKIDKMEKDSKGKGCKYESCRSVEEYNDGSSTFYWINDSGTANPMGYHIYDYNGIMVCSVSGSYYAPCGNIGYAKNFIRLIWQEN